MPIGSRTRAALQWRDRADAWTSGARLLPDGLPLDLPARLRAHRLMHRRDRDRRSAGQRAERAAAGARVLGRGCRRRGVPGALPDRLLDRGPAAAGRRARRRRDRRRGGRAGQRGPAPADRDRRAAAPAPPRLQLRGRDPPRAGARRRPEDLHPDLPRVLRGPPDRVGHVGDRDDPARRRRRPLRRRPAVRGRGRARARRARRDLRGHVGADHAQRGGGARRRDRAAEPLGQPDHDRAGRRPQAAVPLGVAALPRRLRLRGRRARRVHDRPLLGRADHDLRGRPPAGRERPLPRRRTARGRRRRPRPAAPGAHADGDLRRQLGRARPRVPPGRASSWTRRRATSGCGARSSATRSSPPTASGSTRTATRPTTSRSRG